MNFLSKHAVIAAGVLLIVAAVFSNAFDFGVSADAVSASWCSDGSVDAWVSNAPAGASVYFSAQTGYASANIASPSQVISSSGTAAAAVTVSVPYCTYGSHLVTLTAQVCNATGCETQSKKIVVNAQSCPGVQCANTYTTGETKVLYPTPNPSSYCGSAPCGQVQSTIVREVYYAPTFYSAALERVAAQRCIAAYCTRDQLLAGETIALQLFARNTGAAGSFEVRADTASSNLVVVPKSVSFEMARSERTALDFLITARPESFPGSYAVTFSIWHGGVKLDEFTQWIEVVTSRPTEQAAKLVLPPASAVSACNIPSQVSIPATLFNPGSTQQFVVNAQLRGQTVYSQSISVAGGSTAQFEIVFDSARLQPGDNWLGVSASSAEFEGSGRINVVFNSCGTGTSEKLEIKEVATSQSGNTITIIATVANTGSTLLSRVTGELSGLPSGWSQSSATLFLTPGNQANLTVTVTTNSGGVVRPVLAVKNEGRTLATRQMGEINQQGFGLTGFLTLGDTTLVAIIIVLMLLAAVMLFAASSENQAATRNLRSSAAKAK